MSTPSDANQPPYPRPSLVSPSVAAPAAAMSTGAAHLTLLKAIYFAWFGANGALIPYLTLHYLGIGLSGSEIGLLVGLAPFVTLVAAPLWGAIADILHQHKRVLSIAILGVCLCTLGVFLARSLALLLPIVLLNTLFASPAIALVDHSTLVALGERRELYGRQRVWGAVGWGTVGTVVGYLTQRLGLSWAFYAFFAMMALTLTLAVRLPVAAPPLRVPYRQALRILLQRRWLAIVLVTVFVQMAGRATGFGFLTLHLNDLGASRGVIGISVAFASLSEIAVFFSGDALLRRLGRRGTLLFSLGVTLALLLGYGLAHAPWVILLAQLLQGPSYSGMWLAGVDYARSAAPEGLGATTQTLLEAVVWGLGMGSGNLVGGLLYEAFGAGVLFRCAALAVGGAMVFFLLAGRGIPE